MAQAQSDPRIPNLQDTATPFGVRLSGIYKRSYAHVTIKDRLPVILTKIVDTLCQNRSKIIATYSADAEEDIKEIIGFISQLKNEMVTNKVLKPLRLNKAVTNDAEEWNKYFEYRTSVEGETPTWFNTIWLYCETYMYRVLAQEISLMNTIHGYDPFECHKQNDFINSLDSIDLIITYVKDIICNKEYNMENSKNDFLKFLELSLWGNRHDLSATAGSPYSKTGNPLTIVDLLKKNVVVNDWEVVWDIVNKKMKESDDIHIVLDNAGYELFTDLCLAAFLITIVPTTKITFHAKLYPWYVSDTTIHDFLWTLDYMSGLNDHPNIQLLGKMFGNLMDRKVWCVKEEPYWTGPYDFTQIKEKAKDIYAQFSDAKLVIFKGDLNYRKLLGDMNFEYNTSFAAALGNFRPTNILSLRTMKCDICVGLPNDMVEFFEKDKTKLTTGEYGLIQAAIFKI
ncbi:protein-glutamate O-methyltransferase-like [Temnothorax curvispinosus]|uniref:Sugar phosphate phosphatase n=1 Tax=Temnothorax curvispinosus TaxID=300111 RepID=A0A6J1Q3A5_9HYME|nr:protein-glutamate O-methyltransferase-like [Temnothorax curvispinosus]